MGISFISHVDPPTLTSVAGIVERILTQHTEVIRLNNTETLRGLRQTAGLTMANLAETMGISNPSLVAWETGQAWPTIDKLPALGDALGVDMNELVPVLIRTRGGGKRGAA